MALAEEILKGKTEPALAYVHEEAGAVEEVGAVAEANNGEA
ncbi:hypothetical protein ES703_111552 [subsurface metagenome]